MNSSLWLRQFVGILLVVGSGLFLVGAANPLLVRVWISPDEIALPIIRDHPLAWRTTALLMSAATVLTAVGLWLLADLKATDGSPLARAGALLYALAAALWLCFQAFRLTVTPAAAAVIDGPVDPAYSLMGRWASGLFATFTILAGAALILFGTAWLTAGTSTIAGLAGVVLGAVIVVGFVVSGDMPPFVAFLPTGLFGLVLLMG